MDILTVQSKKASISSSLTVSVTLDNPPVIGNALIASYRESDGAAVVTLPNGFQWTPLSPFGPAGRLSGITYKEATDGTQSFVFESLTLDSKNVILREVSGLDLDTLGPEAITPNTLSVTALALDPAGPFPQPDMYVMANVNLSAASGGSNAIDSGFSLLESAASDTLLAAELVTSSVSALAPTWQWLTARAAQGQMASFIGASDPPPSSQPWPRGHVALHRRRNRRLQRGG